MTDEKRFLAIDAHVHVDERVNFKKIPAVLRLQKLDGAGIVTHNDFSFAKKVAAYFKQRDKKKKYIAGVEVDTSGGHLLAYGIDQEIPQNLSPEETVEIIRDLGGISIIPHPFMSHNSIGWRSYVIRSDAMEFYNGFAKLFLSFPNTMAEVAFRHDGFGKVGGSDAHYAEAVGSCYTLIEVDEDASEEAILEAIRQHKTIPKKRPIDKNDVVNFFKVVFTPKEGRKPVKLFKK